MFLYPRWPQVQSLLHCECWKYVCWTDKWSDVLLFKYENDATGWVQRLTLVIPALWEAEVGRSPEPRSSRPAWALWEDPICTKNTNISWAWWHVPVISTTQEAEAGESLEPGRWRLQWAEIAPLHSSLGNRARLRTHVLTCMCLIGHTVGSRKVPF